MNVELINFDEVFDKVEGVVDRTGDLRRTGDDIDKEFAAIEAEQFASRGASGRGGVWEPLKRSTVEAKRKAGQSTEPLVRSGRMRDALTRANDPNRGYRPTENEIEWSFPAYTAIHQKGGKKQRPPQREVVSLTDEQRQRLFAPVVRKAREEVQRLR